MEYCNGGDLECYYFYNYFLLNILYLTALLLIKGYLEESEAIIHFEEILHGF